MNSSTPLQRSVNWIKAHHTSLNLLSSLISSSSYLLPSRFSSSDSTVEFTCAISDLISLLNQLCKHESNCMGSNGMTINGDGGNSSGDGGNGSTITSIRILITIIEIIQLSLEKASHKPNKPSTRSTTITSIEATKTILRLLLLHLTTTSSSILSSGGEIIPGLKNPTARQIFIEGIIHNGGVKVRGEQTGRNIRLPVEAVRRGEGIPSLNSNANDDDADLSNSSVPPPSNNILKKLGEILHILRPLIYSKLNYSTTSTTGTWIPWLTSLIIDVVSHKLTSYGLIQETGHISKPNALELKRRKTQWFLYVLRAPIFKKGIGKIVNLRDYITLPGFEMVFRYVVGWMVYVKENHFLLESMC
ncbi:hypothetical protein TL16_g09275 [Triparma laevis f. inornata]|uniref:Peroxisomal membrane protein PEX16 n=2 Tax=Triparma laevis TaxID=1534972 RepID=A0A9W7FL13_9STRA|nr:hypothetical protein TL16_g09275 [Triparma laevis f. inornata]GMI14128.1 hypothetical protein TrLO_g5402 [Triparma laevis f. longispina]